MYPNIHTPGPSPSLTSGWCDCFSMFVSKGSTEVEPLQRLSKTRTVVLLISSDYFQTRQCCPMSVSFYKVDVHKLYLKTFFFFEEHLTLTLRKYL